VPVAPAASRAIEIEAHERRHHRFTGIIPAFPAQWFYGFLRALPGVPSLLAAVDTGTGHQDHTTSPYAPAPFVLQRRRVPSHPAPNVRDDRDTPLLRERETAADMPVIWVRREAKYFFERDWTAIQLICPSGKSG
jgi:hypothetical protein